MIVNFLKICFEISEILKNKLVLTHRQKVLMAPILTNDSILDAPKYTLHEQVTRKGKNFIFRVY